MMRLSGEIAAEMCLFPNERRATQLNIDLDFIGNVKYIEEVI